MLEKLERGYRLPYPESDMSIDWSPMGLYNELSTLCFHEDLKARGCFADVVRILDEHLTSDEKQYDMEMREFYEKTIISYYLKVNALHLTAL